MTKEPHLGNKNTNRSSQEENTQKVENEVKLRPIYIKLRNLSMHDIDEINKKVIYMI